MSILGGYWESWNNVVPNIPSSPPKMCIDYVCPDPSNFLQQTQPFNRVYFAFTLLSKNWFSGYDPQNSCNSYNTCGGNACPSCGPDQNIWSEDSVFRIIPECRKLGDVGIIFKRDTTLSTPTNGLNAYREVGRLLHQSPYGPKEFYISFGGWTDCPVLPTDDKGLDELATMAVNLVLYSFADGIDLDFEHFSIKKNGGDTQDPAVRKTQLQAFGKWIVKMREKFNKIDTQEWNRVISDTNTWLDSSPDVIKTGDYYKSNKAYLVDLCRRKPSFGIHYTTRFNAFVASSKNALGFATDFATDGEGLDLFQNTPNVKDAITGINLMTYDQAFPATGANENKQTVDGYLTYFRTAVLKTRTAVSPKTSISIGIETGVQAGDSTALRMETFVNRIGEFAKDQNVGVFFWAINDKQGNQPSLNNITTIQKSLGLTVDKTSSLMQYTKCDDQTGWVLNPKIPKCGNNYSLLGMSSLGAVKTPTQDTKENMQMIAAVALSSIAAAAGVSGAVFVSTALYRPGKNKPRPHWTLWLCLVVAFACLIAAVVLLIVHSQKQPLIPKTTLPHGPSPEQPSIPKTTLPHGPSPEQPDAGYCIQTICLRE